MFGSPQRRNIGRFGKKKRSIKWPKTSIILYIKSFSKSLSETFPCTYSLKQKMVSASYRRLRRPCLQYVDKTDKSRWTHCRTCSNASRSCVSAFTTPSVRFSSTGSSSPAGKSTSYWTTGPDAAPPEVLEELWQSSLLSLDLLLSLLCHGHHLTDCTSSSSLQLCRLDVRFRVWTPRNVSSVGVSEKKSPFRSYTRTRDSLS